MMSGARLFQPRRFVDVRGWFSEISSDAKLAAAGIDVHFVQENQSRSHAAGTVRGLHFQTPPMAQAKLVRCVRGALYDVVVDVRSGSPTFGRWIGAELSADNGLQFYRVRPWFCNARTGNRNSLPGFSPLCSRLRFRHRVERSGTRNQLAITRRSLPHPVRQGSWPAAFA